MDAKIGAIPSGAADWKASVQGAVTTSAEKTIAATGALPQTTVAPENITPEQQEPEIKILPSESSNPAAEPAATEPTKLASGPGETSQSQVAANTTETAIAAYGRIVHLLGKGLDPDADPGKLVIEVMQKLPDQAQRDAVLKELSDNDTINLALKLAKAVKIRQSPDKAPAPEMTPVTESVAEIEAKIKATEQEAVNLCAEAIAQGMWNPDEANISPEEKTRRQGIRLAIKRYQNQYDVHAKAKAAIEYDVQMAVRDQNNTLKDDHKPPMDEETQKAFEAKFRQHNYSRDGKTKKILNTTEEKWFKHTVETNTKREVVKDVFEVRDGSSHTLDTFDRCKQPVELMEAMRELAAKKGADVQGKLQTLQNYYIENKNGGGFVAKSENELQAEKRNAFVKGNVEDKIVEHIKGIKTEDGKSLIEVDGATGKIITIHDELLKDMALDEALMSDEMLLGICLSLDKPTDQAAKENLMSQLYRRLAQKNPDLFKDGPDMRVLVARLKAIDDKIIKWLDGIDPNHRHTIPKSFENNPVALLSFISAVRKGGLVERTPRGEAQLTERGKEFFEKLKGSKRIEPEDTSFILTIATDQNADYADSFLSQEFGISAETISDPNQMKKYVDLVMRDMESSGKITKEEMAICRKVSENQMSDVNFAKLANKFGLPPWAGVIFMLSIVLLPSANQLAGETGDEGKSGGGGSPP